MTPFARLTAAGAENLVEVTPAVPVDVLVLIGALGACATVWLATLVRRASASPRTTRRREAARAQVAAAAVLLLLVGVLVTDYPRSSGAAFWAEHALLTGVITTCALLGLGYVFVDRHERRQERERVEQRRVRDAELAAQGETITREMIRTVTSDIFLIRTVYGRLGSPGLSLDEARAQVDIRQEIVSDALTAARSWFVGLSGAQHAEATRALTMLADYMSHLRGVEFDIRSFQLNAAGASIMSSVLTRACTAIDAGVDRADARVRAYVQSVGLDPQQLIVEEFRRRTSGHATAPPDA